MKLSALIREEQGTADNIKSDLTRGHVVDSLGKVIQRLKLYKKNTRKRISNFLWCFPSRTRSSSGKRSSRNLRIRSSQGFETISLQM